MNERIKIIHTDDQKFTRQSTRDVLKAEGIDIIGEAENGFELLDLLRNITPDLILLDLQMPKMDGNKALALVKKQYPNIKIVVFTSFTEECLIENFKAKGVNAFITKNTEIKTVANTIKRVHYSENYNRFERVSKSLFSPREVKIIPHLLDGKTSKEIGELEGISFRTVEAARARVYEKTKCKNASEFARHCAEDGLQFLA